MKTSLSAIASLSIILLGVGCSVPCALPQHPGDEGEQTRVLWLGDTLLADAAQPTLEEQGYGFPFEGLPGTWDADWVIANAEGPFTNRTEPLDPDQRWSYNADPAAAAALASFGVDAASLANNHGMDRGLEGLEDSLRHLEAAGIQGFGAGMDLEEARAPFWMDTPAGAWAVLAFAASEPAERRAGLLQGGVLPLERGHAGAAVEQARADGADFVAAFVHWGSNYSEITSSQRGHASMLADLGFDLAVGHGPHVEQPLELICGMPVAWSLGNFVFGTPGRFSAEFPGYGLLLHSLLGPTGVSGFEVRCLRTDNREVDFQPTLCAPGEAREVLESLHPELEVEGERGVWRL